MPTSMAPIKGLEIPSIKTSMNPHGICEAILEDMNNKQRHMHEQ